MVASDILFIGVGQAGNNLVSAIRKEDESINGFLINTNDKDFARIRNVPENCKYAIPLASGTGKDREKAKDYVEEYVKTIYDKITAFRCHHIYFAFSTGGGSGSGMTPLIIKLLSSLGYNSDKSVNIVPILPFKTESKEILENSIECWNDIVNRRDGILEDINAIYLIDNNKRDSKTEINTEFARLFVSTLNVTDSHPEYVLDGSEVQLLMTANGMTSIVEFDEESEDLEEEISAAVSDSIFVTTSKTFERVGISAPEGFDFDSASTLFTTTVGNFYGISETKQPLLILSGATPTEAAVKDVMSELERKVRDTNRKLREEEKSGVDATIDLSNLVTKKKSKREIKKQIDISDALKDREALWEQLRHRRK